MKKERINLIIYLLILVIFIFTIVDVKEVRRETSFSQNNILSSVSKISESIHSTTNNKEHDSVLNYLVSEIEEYGVTKGNNLSKSSYQTQVLKVSNKDTGSSLEEIINGSQSNNTIINEPLDITNLIVHVPANTSSPTRSAVMLSANYDSSVLSKGASDNALGVAVLLEAIRYYQEKLKTEYINNDLVFVFVDAANYSNLGMQSFIETYSGFDDIVKRIKFSLNITSNGTSGTLSISSTSTNDYKVMKTFSKINKNTYASSFITNITKNSNLDGAGFTLSNFGQIENNKTQNDTYYNLGNNYLSQQALFVEDFLDYMVNANLGNYESSQESIFFSYLNITTIVISYSFMYVLLLILLILFILLLVNRKKENKQIFKTVIITGILILTTLVSFIIGYHFYNLSALIFGHINIRNYGNIAFSDSVVLLLILLSMGISALVYKIILKKYKIEKEQLLLSLTYIFTILSIIISPFVPYLSYLFIIPAILLITRAFMAKYTIKIRLNLLILTLIFPLFYPVISLSLIILGIKIIWFMFLLVGLLIVLILPDLNEILTIKIRLEGQDNRLNIAYLIISVSLIFLAFKTLFIGNISTNHSSSQENNMLAYDDALVYVNDDENSKYLIKDLDAYTILRKYIEMSYNKELGAYTKEDTNNNINLVGTSNISYTFNVLQIKRNSLSGYVEITFSDKANVDHIIVSYDSFTEEYYLDDTSLTLRIRKSAEILIVTTDSKEASCQINAHELLVNYSNLLNYGDFISLKGVSQAKYNLINVTKIK